jgi:tRNA(Leu) C34 or U34 (ribose-2'-O)-methylase TrmL
VPELGDRRAGLLAAEIGEVARGHAPAGGVEDEREGSHGAVHAPTSVTVVTDAETDLTPPEAVLDTVGVGPWPGPWPEDPRYDPELLRHGDRRNVVDGYRYWSVDAIVADLDRHRHPFHVAIENWRHDLNIGTVVRTANAFLAEAVHIVGKKRWNRRGAMVTDRYQHVQHHADVAGFVAWARAADLPVLAVDNLPGARPLESADLPRACVLLFGQEGSGLSDEARDAADGVLSIAQFGSTRSINAGVAAGIAMHAWIRRHADL